MDTDGNGVLSEQELAAFKQQLSQAAGDDGKLSKSEAQGFMQSLGLKGKVDNFYGFLNSMMQSSDKIKSSTTNTENNTQTTNYNDGSSATVDKDGNIVTTQTDGSSVTTDRSGNKLSEAHLIKADTGETEGTFTTEYSTDGTKSCDITDTAEKTETVTYNSEGTATTMDVLEKETSTHDFYNYDTNGENPVLKTRIENEGKAEETTTSYEYQEDGKISQTTTTPKGGEPVVTDYEYSVVNNDDIMGEGQVCTQTTNKGQENESVRTETTYELSRTVETKNSEGTTTERFSTINDPNNDGNPVEKWAGETTTTKDGTTINAFPDGDGVITKVTIPGDDSCTVTTKTNSEGKNEYQSFTQNGETTTVKYTPEGNTPTVMQLHENIDTVSERFGVSKEELLAVNPDKKPDDFGPGASIVIPGEIPASEMVGRKDYEGVASDFKNYKNELHRQHSRQNAKRLENEVYLDTKTYTENGRKVVMDEAVGTKEQQQGSGDGNVYTNTVTEWGNKQQYQVVGKTKGGDHYIVRDKKNGLHYANKNLTHIEHLSTEDMGNAVDFKKGTGQKKTITFDKEDAYGGKKEVMLTGKKDKYGNEYAVTDRGHEVIIDKKTGRGCYVGSKYDKRLQETNQLENNTPELATEVTNQLNKELDAVYANFDDYLKHATMCEEFAEWCSGGWGSENRQSVVKEKFNQERAKLNELEKYRNNPELYAKKFYQTFKVPFNSRNVTNYVKETDPDRKEAARKLAFGDGEISSMVGTVDRYIASQERGGEVVEFGLQAAGNMAGGVVGGLVVSTLTEGDKFRQGRLSGPQEGDKSRYGHVLSEQSTSEMLHNAGKMALGIGVSCAMKSKGLQQAIDVGAKGTVLKQTAKQVVKTGGKEGKAALTKETGKHLVQNTNETLVEGTMSDTANETLDYAMGYESDLQSDVENSTMSSYGNASGAIGKNIAGKASGAAANAVHQKYVKPAINKFTRNVVKHFT